MSDSYEMESRKSWTYNSSPSEQQLALGCQQRDANALERIATAAEAMAKAAGATIREYDAMVKEQAWYRDAWEKQLARGKKLNRTIAGLRGCVARMKRERKAGAK
jgi:hypothetical protein